MTMGLLCAVRAQAQDAKPPRTRAAVLVLRAGDASSALADNLTEILIAAISKLDRFEIVGKEEFQAILGVQSEDRALTCLHDTTCLSKVGLELGIQEVIVGNVSKRGAVHSLVLDRVDVQQAKVLRHVFHEDPTGEGLVDSLFALAEQLFEDEAAAAAEPSRVPDARQAPGTARSAALGAWATAGVGVVATGVALFYGIRVRNAAAEVTGRCCVHGVGDREVYNLTRVDALQVRDDVASWSLTANVLYAVGAVALGTSAWLFVSPSASPASLVPLIAPQAGGLSFRQQF